MWISVDRAKRLIDIGDSKTQTRSRPESSGVELEDTPSTSESVDDVVPLREVEHAFQQASTKPLKLRTFLCSQLAQALRAPCSDFRILSPSSTLLPVGPKRQPVVGPDWYRLRYRCDKNCEQDPSQENGNQLRTRCARCSFWELHRDASGSVFSSYIKSLFDA